MKAVLGLAVFLLFSLLFSSASGLELSTNSAQLCATDTAIFIFSVTNTENFVNSYTVSFSDSAARWAIAAPAGFNLKPGATESVYVYVTPSVSALPGTYALKITLNSASGVDSATATITVKDCHSASLNASVKEVAVCSATEAKYLLNLANSGKYTENFALSISGVPAAWSVLSEELVRLEAGQSRDIVVYSTPPADQTGNFTLTVKAASQNSRALASIDLALISKPCYDYSAAVDSNYVSFCENSEAKIPLLIENHGSVDNSYAIEVQGPAWSAVENTVLEIPAGQARWTNLTLFPGFGVAGDFKVKIIIKPKTGDSAQLEVRANVRSCHSTSLKLAALEDSICPYTSKLYAGSLVNTGEFDEKYALTVTGAPFVSLDKSFVELSAGNSTQFNLLVEPKDVPAESRTIVVRAEAQDPSHAAATSELKLNIAPMSACYGVAATAALTSVRVTAGEPAVVPIIIENKGLENATYNLDVSGTGAQFVQLNPASLTLPGKAAKTVYAYVAVPEQTAENSYKVTVSARLADGTVSSTTGFTINLGIAREEEPAKREGPQARTLAARDKIRAFFGSIAQRLNLPPLPTLAVPKLALPEVKLPRLALPQLKVTKEEVEEVRNKTELGLVGQNISNVSLFLSPAVAAKLSAANESAKTQPAAQPAAEQLKAKLTSISLPALGLVQDFLTQRTYYIPNWLFILAVIVVVAGLSYAARRKDLIEKFSKFLEEEPEEQPAETQKAAKPSAQELLDETDKGNKTASKKPRGRPKKSTVSL